eukprot:4920501-Alexandrium_andersonii.AAC.1
MLLKTRSTRLQRAVSAKVPRSLSSGPSVQVQRKVSSSRSLRSYSRAQRAPRRGMSGFPRANGEGLRGLRIGGLRIGGGGGNFPISRLRTP